MIIKICGVTTVEAALAAEMYGADCIGLVFAQSKRSVDLPAAQKIAAAVSIAKIGVFVNAPLSEVKCIARELKLNYVQLHGNEPAQYCQAVGVPVIKAFPHTSLDAALFNSFPAEWILLDTYCNGRFGGVGNTFDWESVRAERAKLTKPLFIAGGLDSANVKQAIQCLKPDGVDVSSGVETSGRKCQRRMAEFIAAAREGERCYAKQNC